MFKKLRGKITHVSGDMEDETPNQISINENHSI